MKTYNEFLFESRYRIEEITDKFYIFRMNKKLYLLEIIIKKDDKIYFRILLPVEGRFINPLTGKRHHYGPYFVTFSKWKREKRNIIFSSLDREESILFFNSKILKNLELDPFCEEEWGYEED